ncbi:uncharacterized protein [Acropora muricata]|uniref:uncharacterized protein n=1 Tax=Acropora muricata TaxID=159855 RepID=UPI0034E4E609
MMSICFTTCFVSQKCYRCPNGTVVGGLESLLLLLRRLTYPNRLSDLCSLFGRPEPELSMIVHKVLDDIYNRYHHLLENLDVDWINAQTFADAIHAAGATLPNCWGFIDGTLRPCCRPIRNQRILFSGHKRVHGIKFQSVVCPNGLIAHLYGPIAGRHHDAFLLYESNLLPALRRKFPPPNIFTLYGDTAYPIRQHILGPYRGAGLTPLQEQFNGNMSKLRESVEWGFGKIVQYFAFLDFSKNLKFLLQPIGKYYVIGTLFTNCHTCLYGSTTTSLFGVPPPGIEEYLSN